MRFDMAGSDHPDIGDDALVSAGAAYLLKLALRAQYGRSGDWPEGNARLIHGAYGYGYVRSHCACLGRRYLCNHVASPIPRPFS